MKIKSVQNPVWANSEHTAINCEIEHSEYGWIPFTASQTDPEEHGKALFAACLSGDFGLIAEYVPLPTSVQSTVQMSVAEQDERIARLETLVAQLTEGNAS
jgi:hypothetical protein